MNKKFVPWIVCDQSSNKCPTIEELKEVVDSHYDGCPDGYEFEISLVKKNNKFGQRSCGWAGEDKIILFDNEDFEFSTLDDLHEKLISFYKRASKKCDKMNKSKENNLY